MDNKEIDNNKIEFFKSKEIGIGTPYAYTPSSKLLEVEDIFIPSVRDFHVIFWIKKGQGQYVVDFKTYDFKPNTLILVSKDQLHYFLPLQNNEVEIDSIVFNPEFVYRNEGDLKHLFRFQSVEHLLGEQILTIPNLVIDKLEVMGTEMNTIFTSWDGVYQSKAFYHWLCLFLIQVEMLQESQKTLDDISVTHESETLLKFQDLLEQHFKEHFKVEFYAEQLNLSVKSLAQLIKDHYKMSPKSVIDERRILEIKRQLQGTSKSGKTIAYELGFGEPTNMFKYFKKHVGITPNEFKNQNQ